MDEQLKYALLHKTVNERTSSEAGATPAILKISNKTNGAEFHRRIKQVAPSNSFSKDNVNSHPQTQKKGRPSIIRDLKHQDGRHDDGIPEVYFPFRSCAEPEKLTAICRRPVVCDGTFAVLT